MGNMLNLTARQNVLAVYQSKPDTAVRGGLVILQEIFGLNSHIRLSGQVAEQGWHGLTSALIQLNRILSWSIHHKASQGPGVKDQVTAGQRVILRMC